jgi:cytochrome P450
VTYLQYSVRSVLTRISLLLTPVTVKANAESGLPSDQRVTDQEMLDIVNTILSAGSDTVALAIIWALHFLATHPEAQARLREEVTTVPLYSPSQVCTEEEMIALFDSIDSLPYLDAVLKESLRLSPSVHSTIRVAMMDDEIPLSEEMKMRDGSVENVFRVKKGQWIHIPLEASNIDRAIWGEDAWEFKYVTTKFNDHRMLTCSVSDPNDGNRSPRPFPPCLVLIRICSPFRPAHESVLA